MVERGAAGRAAHKGGGAPEPRVGATHKSGSGRRETHEAEGVRARSMRAAGGAGATEQERQARAARWAQDECVRWAWGRRQASLWAVAIRLARGLDWPFDCQNTSGERVL